MSKCKLEYLPVYGLTVDGNVQRSLDRSRAAAIADKLDVNALGVLTVSRRANGANHVIDGQHRVEGLRLAGGENEKVQCRVFTGLSLEDEARLFRLLNNTKGLQALDKFRVRVVEGEPNAVAIYDMLTKYGWKVNFGGHDGSFSAVASLERVFLRDAAAAERAIATVTRAWGHLNSGGDGRIVEGIGLVYARYGSAADDSDVVERLAKYPGGPTRLLGAARGVHDVYRISVTQGVADIVVELYNARRKTRAIAPWRAS